jgi:hypothetical protein
MVSAFGAAFSPLASSHLTALGATKEGYSVIVNEKAIGTMFIKNKEKYFKKLREADVKFI